MLTNAQPMLAARLAAVRQQARDLWRVARGEYKAYLAYGVVVAVLVSALEAAFHANNPQILTNADSISFTTVAHKIMNGDGLVHALRLPTYPLLIALIFRVFGNDNLGALYVVQHAIFVLAALEVYAMAALILRRPAMACVLALFVGLDLYPLGYANVLIAEGLTLFFALSLSVCVALFLRAPRQLSRWLPLWLVTLCVVLLCFTRAEWIYLPVPLFLYLGWRAKRRGLLRPLLPHFALSLLLIYALVGAYVVTNGVRNGYYGVSLAQNPNLLGKVLQYHLSGASPQYADTDRIVRAYEATGATEPYVLSEQVDPQLSANDWSLAEAYSISVIERHPVSFAVDTVALVFNPQGGVYQFDFAVAGHPFAGMLAALNAIANALGGLLLLAPVFAFGWWLLLLWKPTRHLLVVEAMGAVGVVVMFDRVLTVAGSYGDYPRLQSPIAPLEIVLTLGTLVILIPMLPKLLARAHRDALPAPQPIAEPAPVTMSETATASATLDRD